MRNTNSPSPARTPRESGVSGAQVPEGEYRARIDCLSMFVRRLYRRLRKYEPDADVIRQANMYLKAIGQAGTPLRAEECGPVPETPHSSVEHVKGERLSDVEGK